MRILAIILTLGFSTFAVAKNYGEAGCGLGAMVLGKDGNQLFASTLNTTGVQTFGISTGTSNCTDDGAVADNKNVIMFIEVNRTALANESAKGNGETVNGLAKLLNVDSNNLGATLKENYKTIFVDTKMEPYEIQAQIESYITVL